MIPPPVLVDFYCCLGGASEGYRRAGFEVVGVDLFEDYNRRRYPFRAYRGDVLVALRRLLAGERLPFVDYGNLGRPSRWLTLEDVAALAASPPCQDASAGTRAHRATGSIEYPKLIEPTRDLLEATGRPYVIENVEGADLRDPLTLCWSMFHEAGSVVDEDGVPLRMERHRLFESNVPISAPAPCHHPAEVQVAGSYGGARRTIAGAKERGGGYVPTAAVQARLLGVDDRPKGREMTEDAMHQCIPPSYTRHLGTQLLAHLTRSDDAA